MLEENTNKTKLITECRQSLITVEGNIASGKSTLLNNLENNNFIVLPEPLEKWKNWNLKGKIVNMLELIYKEPKKYMKEFQFMAQKTLCENHNFVCVAPSPCRIKVMERSLYSDQYVFVDMAYHDGNSTHDEYLEVCDHFKNLKRQEPYLIIYIRTDPKLCFKRMKERNRKEESNVSLEYLEKLHKYHEELFINNQSKLPCNVIIINGDESKNQVVDKFIDALSIIH